MQLPATFKMFEKSQYYTATEADIFHHALKVVDTGNVEDRKDFDIEVYKGQFTTLSAMTKGKHLKSQLDNLLTVMI